MTEVDSILDCIVAWLSSGDFSATLLVLLEDPSGDYSAIHKGWPMASHIRLPRLTVTTVSDRGEISGLNDGDDGTSRYEWGHAVLQLDVWAKTEHQRDQVTAQVRKNMLVGKESFLDSGGFSLSEPAVIGLNEQDLTVYRNAVRYNVFYTLETLNVDPEAEPE